MIVQTADYLEAATHLPIGGKLIFYDVGWDEYEELLDGLDDHSHLRISYTNGRLEIMSPSAKHEKYKNLAHDLILILSDELEQETISYGSATLKIPAQKGAEGDDCFYIQNAHLVTGKDSLNLTSDPPPDLVIEIDLTSESTSKFTIYAALGVPEIWRYDGREWQVLVLRNESYHPEDNSIAFPLITAKEIAEFITSSEAEGALKARRAFREWVRASTS